MRRILQLTISLAIGGLLLWLSFREVNLADSLQHLRSVPWYHYLLYLALLMVTHMVRAERFRLQLLRMTKKPVAYNEALAMFSVGMAATFLVPFRLGEFVRPYLGKARGHMSMSAGVSTVAAERVIDGLTTTAMLGVVLLLLRGTNIPNEVYYGGYGALTVFGGAFVVFVLGYFQRDKTVQMMRSVLGIVSKKLGDKIASIADRFLSGLNTLPSWRDVGIYEAYTLVYWILNGVSMVLLMNAMGIDPGWTGGFFVLSCLVIGVMIPAPPGNVGNFEYAIILPLTTLGVHPALAAAYAVALHLLQALQMTAVAVFFLVTGKISMQRVVEATRQK